MQGYNVLHTMGWDAFGLPAQRAAERAKLHPAVITERNIANFPPPDAAGWLFL